MCRLAKTLWRMHNPDGSPATFGTILLEVMINLKVGFGAKQYAKISFVMT